MLRPPDPTCIDHEAASRPQELQNSTINQPPLLQHCSDASKRRPSEARLPSIQRDAASPPSSGALARRLLPTSPMPEHRTDAVTRADACANADAAHAIVPCARQEGSVHPRAREHAPSHCDGRTTSPAGHAELLAQRSCSSSALGALAALRARRLASRCDDDSRMCSHLKTKIPGCAPRFLDVFLSILYDHELVMA